MTKGEAVEKETRGAVEQVRRLLQAAAALAKAHPNEIGE